MSLATLKSYLLSVSGFVGLRPASAAAGADEVVPALSGPGGGVLVEAPASTLATEAKQDDIVTALGSLTADPATETTLASVLAKQSSDPATQTTLAAILAKIIAAPATEAAQTTLNGYLNTGTWYPSAAAALADSGIIRAQACTVRTVLATNAHTAARWLMLFDSATVPADATAPRVPALYVPAATSIIIQIGHLACSAGLSWAMSSTQATKTVTSDTKHVVSARAV